MIYCTQKPPETVIIGNNEYHVGWYFLNWALHFEDLLRAGDLDAIQEMFLGGPVCEQPEDIIHALGGFYLGYPKLHRPSGDGGERVFSFKHDLNEIVIAIRNQSGIDLTHRRTEPFHWWDFLLEFETLEEHHMIRKKMMYRGYTGNDKDYIKLRNFYALPVEVDPREIEEINSIFYDS